MRPRWPGVKRPPFDPIFGLVAQQWQAYRQGGHLPGRGEYGDQNPSLLRAFEALDRAQRRADEEQEAVQRREWELRHGR